MYLYVIFVLLSSTYNGFMKTNPNDVLNEGVNRHKYTKEEYDAALDFVKFLYDLWMKRLGDDIIKMDKMRNGEEPQNIN